MDLNTIWFILIVVLWVGFFVLEGFDYGVGILMPFLGKNDTERRVILNTIGPVWDGNEVWLLTAGGATFAAFPNWYATLFSGFYLALFLVLFGLILRGVALEFRSKDQHPRWRSLWDWCIFAGSFLPALLFGVAFANIVAGVPIDQNMTYTGNLFTLLNPYALVGGLVTLSAFTLYGAIFLSLKTTGDLEKRAQAMSWRLWPVTVAVVVVFFAWSYFATDILHKLGVNPGFVPIAMFVVALLAGYFIRRKQSGLAFVMTALTIVLYVITLFLILFPNVMISSTNPAYNLTIWNASSTPYTLTVMTIIAVIFVPIVLLYQGWTYWVFRHRIEAKPEQLTY